MLQSYIQEELNIFDITLTSDEHKVGIKYKATADWGKLGKKLRKDIGRVKAGLPKLTSEEVKAYEFSQEISIDGIPLGPGDLVVTRYVELEDGSKSFDTATDADVVVLLDIRKHPELEIHASRRQLTNRCQQLRKKANLKATDEVDIFYEIEGSDSLAAIIAGHEDTFSRRVGCTPSRLPPGAKEQRQFLIQEEGKLTNGDGDADAEDGALNYILMIAQRV